MPIRWWTRQNKKKIIFAWMLVFFCLFGKWLLIWISRFLWKHPSISLSCWCALCGNIIRIKEFLFTWMLIASLYLIKCSWHAFQNDRYLCSFPQPRPWPSAPCIWRPRFPVCIYRPWPLVFIYRLSALSLYLLPLVN